MPSAPVMTGEPMALRVSTVRKKRLHRGGSLAEPSRPRVTGWRLPASERWAWYGFSVTPTGSAGSTVSSGVRQMLVVEA